MCLFMRTASHSCAWQVHWHLSGCTDPCLFLPQVKCRDCEAFGHKASSTRCPIKHWGMTLVPVALGSRRLKENVEPWSQWDQWHQAGLLDQAEREKAER